MTLPASVEFHEEGPREGFQMETGRFALADRAALIDALSAARLKQIQVGSFVSPRAVPQMADTPDLFAAIHKQPGTRYTALWLNTNGFERARACDQVDLDGKVIAIALQQGDALAIGQTVIVLESMKMELHVNAPFDGTLDKLHCQVGDMVERGQILAVVSAQSSAT